MALAPFWLSAHYKFICKNHLPAELVNHFYASCQCHSLSNVVILLTILICALRNIKQFMKCHKVNIFFHILQLSSIKIKFKPHSKLHQCKFQQRRLILISQNSIDLPLIFSDRFCYLIAMSNTFSQNQFFSHELLYNPII